MNFRDYKKEMQQKKEQEETLREIKGAMRILEKKRDNYTKEAKEALRVGNTAKYNAMVALLKNAIFNIKQAQDMEANFLIARDMCEMQHFNKKFVKSLNSVMKNVYKTSKAIHVSQSEKTFMKALYQQNQTSMELQQALQSNNITFANSVNTMSDITDEEVKTLLEDGIVSDEMEIDSRLDDLESSLLAPSKSKEKEKNVMAEGAPAPRQSAPKPETPKPETPKPEAPKTDAPRPAGAGTPDSAPRPAGAGTPDSAPRPAGAGTPDSAPRPAGAGVPEAPKPVNEQPAEEESRKSPEDELLGSEGGAEEGFVWDNIPTIGFDDIAGLDEVKEVVQVKVLLPLKNPDAFAGYEKKNGGGLCLYGPPGTGKTMIAAAIAKEIGAKFCSVKPSDLLQQGAGNTEKAVRTLFKQARNA